VVTVFFWSAAAKATAIPSIGMGRSTAIDDEASQKNFRGEKRLKSKA
jgi:hypothetical protein